MLSRIGGRMAAPSHDLWGRKDKDLTTETRKHGEGGRVNSDSFSTGVLRLCTYCAQADPNSRDGLDGEEDSGYFDMKTE